MRLLPAALLSLCLAGCSGNVADYIGPRSTIISPQLIRYGLDVSQSRCVSVHLADSLTPVQLRRFQRAAAAVNQGFFDPARLTARDLSYVASLMRDNSVFRELSRANAACRVVTAEATAPPPAPPSTTPAPRPAAWLNLGAAPTGQAIAVDASTLQQEVDSREAWFRLTNPGEAQPLANAYRLRIDCAHRTIQSLARRRADTAAGGGQQEISEAGTPVPVEGGTVMEIAYLALCT
jgi:hypothetical protein